MNGITPIIAVIVLLILTVSIIGVAFVFFSRTTQQAGEDIGGIAEQQFSKMGVDIRIDSAVGNKVYIRNTGSVPIANTSVGFYVNDLPVNASSQFASIQPGQIAEFTIDTTLSSYELKVTGGKKTLGTVVTTTTTSTTTIIQTQTFAPIAGSGTIAGGTLVDDGFTASEVATQNCAADTCDTGNSWNYGFNNNVVVDTQINFSYDLSSLGITGSRITQVTFDYGGCWHGGTARDCDGGDNPEFTSASGTAVFEIWTGSAWEQIGTSINLGTDTSSTADSYNTYSRNKIGGFNNGYLQSGILKIRVRTTGTTIGSSDEVQQVTDFATITVTWS